MRWCDRPGGSFRVLVEPELLQRGIEHGFLGADHDFSPGALNESGAALLASYGRERLHLLRQLHGDGLVEVGEEGPRGPCEGDGFLIRRGEGGGVLCGVRTADCLPVILCTDEAVAVVHAGWRGLVAGILVRVIRHPLFRTKGGLLAAIGPCAGPDRYEVGPEVVAALGPDAVFRPLPEDKALLDLARTAKGQILGAAPHAVVTISDICTISDHGWHSHRRQGLARGSNLCFVDPGTSPTR